jgi:Ca2+-binding RTX toxin-like protein
MTSFIGNTANNTIHTSTGHDTVWADAGDDWLVYYGGNDVFNGGVGVDTLSFMPMTGGVYMNLGLTGWQDTGRGWMQVNGVENLVGSNFTDYLTGSAGNNSIAGWGGDDVMRGMAGNDMIRGGLGNDTFDGGTGTDIASFRSTETNGVRVDLRKTWAQNTNEGMDTFISIESIYGSEKNDVFVGNNGNNVLAGGDGNDLLHGWNGSDTLWGGNGNDTFKWQALNTGVDRIGDFERGKDKIDLDACVAATGFDYADLTISYANGMTIVTLLDNVDYQIRLNGTLALTASDFIF